MVESNDNLVTRHKIEEQFHDTKARVGVDDFYRFGALTTADNMLWSWLGDLQGKRLLEIGCGDGSATVRFAKAGALVTAIDISSGMVDLTKKVAVENGVGDRVLAYHKGGEDIDFPEETFDIVYGHSVLHHLNLNKAVPLFVSILKPNGIAAFLEPLEHNPILNFFRFLTPHRRTPTEKPLTFDQLNGIAQKFSLWEHKEFYLFSLVAFFWYYIIRNRSLFQFTLRKLAGVDSYVFRTFPFVRKYAWVVVVRYTK